MSCGLRNVKDQCLNNGGLRYRSWLSDLMKLRLHQMSYSANMSYPIVLTVTEVMNAALYRGSFGR